jgi:hypothetical protein
MFYRQRLGQAFGTAMTWGTAFKFDQYAPHQLYTNDSMLAAYQRETPNVRMLQKRHSMIIGFSIGVELPQKLRH